MSGVLLTVNASNLDSQQTVAVNATEGPVLIIAGPGSGKTKTLVDRVVHLIETKGLEPKNLLVSTFTEKAAAELLSRISIRLDDSGIRFNLMEMYLGTLHSIFLRLLQDYREHTTLKKSFGLLDSFEQEYFVYRNIRELTDDLQLEAILGDEKEQSSWRRAKNLCAYYNRITERGCSPDDINGRYELEQFFQSYSRYLGLLDRENLLDFSLIQAKCYQLLTEHPNILESLQSQIQYLMVDEYQDTNPIQEKILLLLAGAKKNLCVVGDDDQALYRFRGATIENILILFASSASI
jgi:DNA helicase II / ATP-dependent DNA helicase PcrA